MIETDKIAEALAKAAGAITNPVKNREVTVRSDKGNYKFKYATFDAILDSIRKPLSDNGLWFVQTLDGNQMVTTLYHSSGQTLNSRIPFVAGGNKPQEVGSALTYAKRYGLCALLGIAADEDDDGNAAEGNGVTDKRDIGPRNAAVQSPRTIKPRQENPAEDEKQNLIIFRATTKADSLIKVMQEATSLADASRALLAEGLIDMDDDRNWQMEEKSVLSVMKKVAPEQFKRIQDAYNAKRGDEQ